MKKFENVTSVEFNVTFEGKGCVNFDTYEQGYSNKNLGLYHGKIQENQKFSKKIYKAIEKDGQVENYFKHKVSSDCLRHFMFINEAEFNNSRLSYITPLLLRVIANPAMVLRGYMYATSTRTIRKKTVCSISDAVQTGPWLKEVNMDIHSVSGSKGDKFLDIEEEINNSDDSEDIKKPKQTSLFSVENVPEGDYVARGMIPLTELQFISNDITYDRDAVGTNNGELEKVYLNALRDTFGEGLYFGNYYIENSLAQDEWSERGLLFSRDNVDMLVKDAISRVMGIDIWRKDSYLKFKSITLTIFTKDSDVPEKIEIKSVKDLKDYYFSYAQKYFPADEAKIQKNKEIYENLKKAEIAAKIAKAKEEKKKRDTKKKKKQENEEL